MDANHELDTVFEVSQLTDSTKSLKSPDASKAGPRYKICTKQSDIVMMLIDDDVTIIIIGGGGGGRGRAKLPRTDPFAPKAFNRE